MSKNKKPVKQMTSEATTATALANIQASAKSVFKLVCYFYENKLSLGAELATDEALFFELDEAVAFAKKGALLKEGSDERTFPRYGKPLFYKVTEIELGGSGRLLRTLGYDSSLTLLGEEVGDLFESPRLTPLKAPKYRVGDVVGTVAYGHYVTGVVAAVYDHEDPKDDGCYLVNYGIASNGGIDHVHPRELELFSAATPPQWLLDNLARLMLSAKELKAAVSKLRVR